MNINPKFKKVVTEAIWSVSNDYVYNDHATEYDRVVAELLRTYVKILAIKSFMLSKCPQGYFFIQLSYYGIVPIYAYPDDAWYEVNSFIVKHKVLEPKLMELYHAIEYGCKDLHLVEPSVLKYDIRFLSEYDLENGCNEDDELPF